MTKKLLLTQTILMYLAQAPFYVAFILLESSEIDVSYIFLGGIIASIVVSIFCFVCSIIYLARMRKDEPNVYKHVMIHKLIQVPFYVVNYVISFLVIGGLFNPFLMIAIPFVIALLMSNTYLYTFTTSLPNIIYLVRSMIKEKKANALSIILAILHFVFVADVVSSIIVFARENKKLSQ